MTEKIRKRYIEHDADLIDALKQMDQYDCKLLIAVNKDHFEGLISIGDIQRAIISDHPLSTAIIDVMRKNIKVARTTDSFEDVKQMMVQYRMELCPVINEQSEITEVYFWEDIFENEKITIKNNFNLPVVIMAGGFGTRMRPLTHVLPKPLIPIGEKTILQEIYDRFHRYGSNQFYTSVNYKADFIIRYVNELSLPYHVDFIKEDKPLGTAGSLQLLKDKINETFFVHNCDILIENDYSEILEYHQNNRNEITVVAAIKHISLAYGNLETGEKGELISISEKPEMTFKINTGMYILEPHLLDEIPENQFYHITDLIEALKKRNGKVGVYPVTEKSWKDIGNWEAYLKVINE